MCETRWFRSRPETIEAVRFDGRNAREVVAWVTASGGTARLEEAGSLVLGTGASEQLLLYGAIVVRDGAGRFRALSPPEFEARFEKLETSLAS